MSYEGVLPSLPRTARRPQKASLYPLELRLIIVGAVAAAIALATQDWSIAVAVFALFAMVGASWRVDMVPIIPACIAYQWVSACAGYIFLHNAGYLPGRFFSENMQSTMLLSIAGLAMETLGLRLGMYMCRNWILPTTFEGVSAYNLQRLFTLTLAAFAVSYVVDIAPKAIWFGGAQIIESLLSLRFVPYFMLLVAVFDRRRNYRYLVFATAWVILPQLLTGFSDFKEILFVILIAVLARWRPWIRTPQQARENWRMLFFGAIGAVTLLYMGMVWNGGIKQEWRDRIWNGIISESPIERMGKFFEVASDVTSHLDLERASDTLVSRLTSGEIFFSLVTERVPATLPHENGTLLWKAISNAITPRFLFPEKVNLGGDSWLVRKYAGAAVAGDESKASIGLGYMAEFYIDFGVLGVLLLSMVWGMVGGGGVGLLARVAPSREVFLALILALLTQFFMAFDGSFIKLFAGFLQRTAISYGVFLVVGGPMHRWLAGVRNVRIA
ncbi:MAG: hypothetical protein Q8L23_08565 [Caulobacter sp.]|nr:hypothetical protein [Caulobacter sp.]